MTITENDFLNYWPESRQNQFSYNALRAMFAWYEEIEEAGGNEIEFDPIAFCCEWSEYRDFTDAYFDQNCLADLEEEAISNGEDGDDLSLAVEDLAKEYYYDNATVIEFDGGVLIGQY